MVYCEYARGTYDYYADERDVAFAVCRLTFFAGTGASVERVVTEIEPGYCRC